MFSTDVLGSLFGELRIRNGVYIGDTVECVIDMWFNEKRENIRTSRAPKSQAGLGVTTLESGLSHLTVLDSPELFTTLHAAGNSED